MSELLKQLLRSIFPGANGENDDDVDDPAVADDPIDDDDDDLPGPDHDDDPAPAPTARPRGDDTRDRLARVEAEIERRGRLAAEAETRRAAPVDSEFQREEERLRAADVSDLERWQIQANRTLRATQAEARHAMAQAQDMSDRARFESKMTSDPRRAKYAARVEEEIRKVRATGNSQLSREDAYYWMIGKDIADGKLKSKPKATAAANVPRGRSPGVRSDVQGRGRPSTDRDKLRARLENQNI
jgi:hypothetical protein